MKHVFLLVLLFISFTQAVCPNNMPVQNVVAGDFDNDGSIDFAFIGWYQPEGGGLYVKLARELYIRRLNGYGKYVAAGDFNGDGNLDLVVSGIRNEVQVLLGNGDGRFEALPSFRASGLMNLPVMVIDWNADGFDDLLIGTAPNNQALVYLSNGDGTFQNPISVMSAVEERAE